MLPQLGTALKGHLSCRDLGARPRLLLGLPLAPLLPLPGPVLLIFFMVVDKSTALHPLHVHLFSEPALWGPQPATPHQCGSLG